MISKNCNYKRIDITSFYLSLLLDRPIFLLIYQNISSFSSLYGHLIKLTYYIYDLSHKFIFKK